MNKSAITITQLSENTLLILFQQTISIDNARAIARVQKAIQAELGHLLVDTIVAYASIHVSFNLLQTSAEALMAQLATVLEHMVDSEADERAAQVIEIPVYYGDEVALDLASLAAQKGLDTQQVIEIHSRPYYDVFAIGFAPGFAYLGNVDDRIACARKATPRAYVAPGSVAIADQQTAVYPSASPGGWQIIGRTPMSLVDYDHHTLCPFSIGDQVKFTPISRADYLCLGGVL